MNRMTIYEKWKKELEIYEMLKNGAVIEDVTNGVDIIYMRENGEIVFFCKGNKIIYGTDDEIISGGGGIYSNFTVFILDSIDFHGDKWYRHEWKVIGEQGV